MYSKGESDPPWGTPEVTARFEDFALNPDAEGAVLQVGADPSDGF